MKNKSYQQEMKQVDRTYYDRVSELTLNGLKNEIVDLTILEDEIMEQIKTNPTIRQLKDQLKAEMALYKDDLKVLKLKKKFILELLDIKENIQVEQK